MCRFLGYIGEETSLHSVVYDFPHSLEVQSYSPKELLVGNVNLDGFGCGWYNRKVEKKPAVYATLLPPWADYRFPTISRAVSSNIILAAVRNATPPFPNELSSVFPLHLDNYMFVHNGFISDYDKCRRSLENELPDKYFDMISSRSDSAFILALFNWLISEMEPSEKSLKGGVLKTLDWLTEKLNNLGVGANLNIGISDGETMVFTKHEINGACNSLYLNPSHSKFNKAVLVASEPLDDDRGWESVPDNSLIEISSGGQYNMSDLK